MLTQSKGDIVRAASDDPMYKYTIIPLDVNMFTIYGSYVKGLLMCSSAVATLAALLYHDL